MEGGFHANATLSKDCPASLGGRSGAAGTRCGSSAYDAVLQLPGGVVAQKVFSCI